jgi:phosphoglucosamine mutase
MFLQYIHRLERMLGCQYLDNMKIVLDCANGALSRYAEEVFEDLGAKVFCFNCAKNSDDIINDGCGATHPEFVMQKVLETGADMGFAFDGDGDRVMAADENGQLVDGDQILYAAASFWKGKERTGIEKLEEKREEMLHGRKFVPDVVGTLHTNMGVEKAIKALSVPFHRTDIGDHYVTETMLQIGSRIGGEQSGHIILGDYGPTGDGLAAALFLAKICAKRGRTLSELTAVTKYPQCNLSIVTERHRELMEEAEVKAFIAKKTAELGSRGRILVRASGTEPKLRIMAECKSKPLADKTAKEIEEFILKYEKEMS